MCGRKMLVQWAAASHCCFQQDCAEHLAEHLASFMACVIRCFKLLQVASMVAFLCCVLPRPVEFWCDAMQVQTSVQVGAEDLYMDLVLSPVRDRVRVKSRFKSAPWIWIRIIWLRSINQHWIILNRSIDGASPSMQQLRRGRWCLECQLCKLRLGLFAVGLETWSVCV